MLALIHLGGAQVDSADAAALGLPVPGTGPCISLGDNPASGAMKCDAARCTVVLGYLGDMDRIAGELGVDGKPDSIEVARAALDSWGEGAAARLPGEWVIFDWQAGGATLMQSAARWCQIFHVRKGNRLAISSDLFKLSQLSWVGRELDEESFRYVLASGSRRGRRTMLPGVNELGSGECIRFSEDGTVSTVSLPFVAISPWTGSFAEATEEAMHLTRRILGERLARHGDVACLLSGGLDSSLMAMILADCRKSGQRVFCLTSVAPNGSGLADEFIQARSVAERLGLPIVPVAPGSTPGIYAPDPEAFAEANGPTFSVRHYLYRALTEQARTLGVTGLFDGSFGEMTVTGLLPLRSWRWQLRQIGKNSLGRGGSPKVPSFRVRLARHRLDLLPADLMAKETALPEEQTRGRNERWGYFPGTTKIMRSPATAAAQLPIEYPFRDQRLLQLFAGFPAHFLERDGYSRAPARAMMAGRIPDAVRLRRDAMPFSPDYMLRLKVEAPAASARLADFRKAGVDDWLDLDWLEASLARFADRGPSSISDAFEVQLTAMTAEFLLWWRNGAR